MNKKDMIDKISEQTGYNKSDVEKILKASIEVLTEAVKVEKKVSISGFGIFTVKLRNERTGVNPSTGAKIIIPAKNVIGFKPSKSLSEEIQE